MVLSPLTLPQHFLALQSCVEWVLSSTALETPTRIAIVADTDTIDSVVDDAQSCVLVDDESSTCVQTSELKSYYSLSEVVHLIHSIAAFNDAEESLKLLSMVSWLV